MDVKTFEATTLKDAIRAVKREFGSDAVILSTKQKPGSEGGVSLVEVTAAAAVAKKSHYASAFPDGVGLSDSGDVRLMAIEKQIANLAENSVTKRQVNSIEATLQELRILFLQSLKVGGDHLSDGLGEHAASIVRQMQLVGVDLSCLAKLSTFLKDLAPPLDNSDAPEALAMHYRTNAIRWMLKRIKIHPQWDVPTGSTAIHAIMGASGVGKSSMIAKMASYFHVHSKLKVALSSCDTGRLGAVEQMRVFAKVLGVPFTPVESLRELTDRIGEFHEADILLIDTGGCNPRNPNDIRDFDSVSELNLPIDFHLLLSATEKPDFMDNCVRYFSPVGIKSLMFSKLDEAWGFGDIFNASSKWSLPLSYFSSGASVPGTLERATRESIIERVFGI